MAKKHKIEIEQKVTGGTQLKKATQQTEKHAKSLDKQANASKRAHKADTARYNHEKQAVLQTAPAAKNFSKMSRTMDGGTGAGGLVRAYALLAANVFALSAAFGVLSRAAQVDTLMQSMKVLELQTGKSVTIIGRELQKVSGYGMDLAESMRATSLALSAGFDSSSIKELGEVARNAAVSLGRPMGDALDRIFRGVIKVEPELLDEIGLFVRVKDASAKYASELGVAASSLTEFEKRQAFAAEAIRQGQEKFEAFSSVETDPYSQLAAVFSDLAQEVMSLVNVPLKMLINILTTSKTVLVAVFAGIAGILLKKAIPAMGLFALDAKKAAADAVVANKAYREDLNLGVSAQRIAREKEIKILEDKVRKERDLLMKARKAQTGDFPGQTGKGGKALQAANKQLNQANLRGKKKIEALENKILALNKSKRAVNKAEIKEVQASLKAEIVAEEKLLRLAKERRNVKKEFPDVTPGKGTAAAREELKLATEEATTGSIATAVSTAEFSGYNAGIKALKAEATELGKAGKAGSIKFGFLNKQLFMMKGRAQIATVAIGNLMSKAMVWVQVFVVLIPLAKKILEWFGLWNKEHLAYQEASAKTSELLQTFTDKLEHNKTAMKEATPGSAKLMAAQTAMNNTFSETGTAIKEQLDAFIEMQEKGNAFAIWYETFKKRITGNKTEQELAEDYIRSIVGDPESFKQQGESFMKMARGIVGEEGVERLRSDAAEAARKEAGQFRKLLLQLQFERNQLDDDTAKRATVFKSEGGLVERLFVGSNATATSMSLNAAISQAKKMLDNLVASYAQDDSLIEQLIVGMTGGNFDKAVEAVNKAANAGTALDSVLEGASDTVRQYYDSFVTKGDLDKPVDLFNQAIGKLENMELSDPKRSSFFESILKDESKVRAVLSETNRIAFDNAKTEGERLQILKNQRQEYIEQQVRLIEQKEMQAKLQSFQKLTAGVAKKVTGFEKQRLEAQREILKTQKEITAFKTKEFLSTIDMTETSFNALMDELAAKKTDEERLRLMEERGTNAKEIAEARKHFAAEERAHLEFEVHKATEIFKRQLQSLKIQKERVAAEEKLLDAITKSAQFQAQLDRFTRRGTTKLNPQQEARLMIDAERERLKLIEKQAKIKKAIIDAEMAILKATNVTLEREKAFVGMVDSEGNQITAAGLNKQLDNSAETLKDTIDVNLSNSAMEFGIKLRDAVNQGLDQAFSTNIKGFNDSVIGKQILAFSSGDTLAKGLAAQLGFDSFDEIKSELKKLTEMDAGQMTEKQMIQMVELQSAVDKINTEVAVQNFNALRFAILEVARAAQETFGSQGLVFAVLSEFSISLIDTLRKVGEESFTFKDGISKGMNEVAKSLMVASVGLAGIRQLADASSKNRVAGIDREIEAEKKRDGKSKESLERIRALEAKKEKMQRKQFEVNKKLMMAEVAMNTGLAIMKVMGQTGLFGFALWPTVAALGAAQLAMISGMSYQGGATQAGASGPSSITVGKREDRVDVSQGASAGELAYLRGDRGVGTTANQFQSMSGAAGLRKGYASGGVIVGEQGPEMIQPYAGFNVVPNDQLGGKPVNAHFTINAIDARGVEEVLQEQQGNIIGMIRSAANDYGQEFLEAVEVDHLAGTPKTAGGVDY